jgi:predicted CopG family antitoxin
MLWTMTLTKRIPVSEMIWRQLSNAKEAGRTYDDLLKEMLQLYNRKKLMEKMEKVEAMKAEDLVDIDDL